MARVSRLRTPNGFLLLAPKGVFNPLHLHTATTATAQADLEVGPPRSLNPPSFSMERQDQTTTGDRSTDVTPSKGVGPSDTLIDPELADLPAPVQVHKSDSPNGTPAAEAVSYPPSGPREPGAPMTITESIALAPQPRTTDFSMLPLNEDVINLEALDAAAEDGVPGSPTAKLMKAIAPPNAAQMNPNWPAVSGAFPYLISCPAV